DEDRLARTEHGRQRRVEARQHGRVLLAAGWRRDLAAAPGFAHTGPAVVDLGPGRPLPFAAAALAQAGVRSARRTQGGGDDLGGLLRPAEVGREHECRSEAGLGERLGALLRLLFAERGERRVEPALPPLLD